MRWTVLRSVCTIGLAVLLAMSSLSVAADAKPVEKVATCTEAVAAQDELIELLTKQVEELRAANVARNEEAEALRKGNAALQGEADAYKRLWLAEAEAAAADKKRAAWSERFAALRYSFLGFGVGVVADRWATP